MLRAFFYSERDNAVASLELELLPSLSQCMLPDHRVGPDPLERIVTEDLTNKVVAWATEIASYAAQLPSKQARDDFLRERRRELVTGRKPKARHRVMPRLWPMPALTRRAEL